MAFANRHKSAVPFDTVGLGAKDAVVASVRLSFISFQRAPAIIRNDLTLKACYITSVAKQAIGDRIEMSYDRKKFPGLFVVECQSRPQGQLPGPTGYPRIIFIEVITIKAT